MIRWTSGEKAGTVEHEGAVLGLTSEYHGYGTYHHFAEVWTGETVDKVEIWTEHSEYPSGPWWAEVSVDATPEVLAAVKAWRAERDREAREAAAWTEAGIVRKGRWVKVVRGRKVPKGTEGVVIWTGHGTYGPRVGIKTDAGEVHWTAETNVEVVRGVPVAAPEPPTPLEPLAVSKGAVVRVVEAGREVDAPVGVTGTVIWAGHTKYGTPRVGIKDASGTVYWTRASYVEAVSAASVAA